MNETPPLLTETSVGDGRQASFADQLLECGYRLGDELGRGRNGIVYRAVHEGTAMEVALKRLRRFDPDDLYHLKHEFRSLCEISHPNLAHMHELVVQAEQSFFTMELIDGPDVARWIRQDVPRGRCSVDVVNRLHEAIGQLAALLDTMHSRGWVHRDVKPSNVRVADDERVVLLDFGLMAVVRGSQSQDDLVAGTIAYMAPEAAWEPTISSKADIYSLGVLAYECLTGIRPFAGDDLIQIDRLKRKGLPPCPEDCPGWLQRLLQSMTSTEVADRPSAKVVLEQLDEHAPVARPWSVGAPAFVGRRTALDALRNAHQNRQPSTPTVARITGPSGIGKTHLVRQLLEEIADEPDVVVVQGRCLRVATVPLPGLDGAVDSLSQALSRLPQNEAASCVPTKTAELLHLFPVFGRVKPLATAASFRSAALDLRERRRFAFAALKELVAKLARLRSLLIWIDDFQWCDPESAEFWNGLLAEQIPMMFVSTSRDSKQIAEPALASPVAIDLPLDPLSQQEIEQLLDNVASGTSKRAASLVVRESEGNPFLATQIAHYFKTQRRESVSDERLTLGRVLDARLSEISDDARGLLIASAIATKPLTLATLAEATNVRSSGLAAQELLRAGQLVQRAPLGPKMHLVPYHDRIREALIAEMDQRARKNIHLALAKTLSADIDADPVATFWHWHGAGDEEMAGAHALRAGDRLMDALAFEQAIEVYLLGLRVESRLVDRSDIYERLGNAYELAGRGQLAGNAYWRAATRLADTEGETPRKRQLQRKSAEALLRSGIIEEGYDRLRSLLPVPELRLPYSTARLFAITMKQRLLTGLRWLSFRKHKSGSKRLHEWLDVLWSATVGLVWADLPRSSYYQAFHTRHALASNDPTHRARAIATESCYLAAMGPRLFRPIFEWRARQSLRTAKELDDPHLLALVMTTTATTSFLQGDWGGTVRTCEQAAELIEEKCTAAAGWELSTSYILGALSLGMQGDLNAIETLRVRALEVAKTRGDKLAETWVRVGLPNLTFLARGQIDKARSVSEEALASWPSGLEFSLLQFWALVGQIQADLYANDAGRARTRFEMAVPDIKDSLILYNRPVKSMFHYLDGMTALAASSSQRTAAERRALTRTAATASRHLKHDSLRWPKAMGLSLEAGLLLRKERSEGALALLRQAHEIFREADMRLFCSAVQHQIGRVGSTDDRFFDESVVDPSAMARCLLPIAAAS